MALLAIPVTVAVALALVPLLVKLLGRNAGWPLAITFVALAGYVLANASEAFGGGNIRWSATWIPGALPATPAHPNGGDITFGLSLDALSLFFTLLALLIGAIVFIYSTRYLHTGERILSFYVLMTAFMLAVLLLVLADDVALLFVGWELVSLASFFLIARSGSSGEAGSTRTLILTFVGGLFLIAALGIMVGVTGTTQLPEIIADPRWAENTVLTSVVAVLIALAGFSKAAQIPFHFWLPEAMAADTPVSAFLHAAAVVKAGIYLLLRFSGMFQDQAVWHYMLIIVGMVTALMAAFYAMQKTDLKKLTAYSTVSQLGWIVATIGIGTPFAMVAAVVHTAAHALFKSSLFMLVGVVDHQAGSRDTRRLGSLWRRMPFTFGSAVVAAGSMAAIPPTFGFLSKEGMLTAFQDAPLSQPGTVILLIVAGVGALATFMYSVRYVFGAFVDGNTDESKTTEAPVSLWLPAAIPGLLSLPVVFFLAYPENWLDNIAEATGVGAAETHLSLWHGVNVPLIISIVVLALGVLGIFARRRIFRWFENQPLGLLTGAEAIHLAVEGAIRVGRTLAKPANSMAANRHVIWILFMGVTLGMFGLLGPGRLQGLADLPPRQPGTDQISDLVGLVIIGFAVVAIVSTRSRLASVIIVGIAGVGVSLMMLTLGAPDVALTNLLVEFCVTVIMMLVVRHQPRLYLREGENRAKFATVVATVVGLVTFFGVWLLQSRHPRPELAEWYLKHTDEVTGAHNIVAAILVEFRGYDTLGELSVLGMAGIVIAAIIRSIPKSPKPGYGPGSTSEAFRAPGSTRFPDVHKVPELAPFYSKNLRSTHLNSILPRMALYPMIPIVIILSLVTFWRGHSAPGGGFLAALVAACGLFFWYLAQSRARKLGTDNLGYALIGIGMLLALGTGIVGFLQGSFLAPIHGHFLGQDLTTSLLFDGGIYFAVFGLIVVVINQLGGAERPGNDKTDQPTERLIPARTTKATIQQASEAAERTVADAFSSSPVAVKVGGSNIVLNPSEVSEASRKAEARHRAEREAAKRPVGSVSSIPDAKPSTPKSGSSTGTPAGVRKNKPNLPDPDAETDEEFKKRVRRERRLTGHDAFDRELDELRKRRGKVNPDPQEKRQRGDD